MNARDYNAAQLDAGRLTWAHITELIDHWQSTHRGLDVDGMAGPMTIASIDRAIVLTVPDKPALFLRPPLPVLADGRRPQVTNGFNPPAHIGLDWFYAWQPSDGRVADHGYEGSKPDGSPAWLVPIGTRALAMAAGLVTFAEDTPTGHAVWIDHGNGWRSGTFHLADLLVAVGDHVLVGGTLGAVGYNPQAPNGRHPHVELSPIDRYAPVDPTPFLLA